MTQEVLPTACLCDVRLEKQFTRNHSITTSDEDRHHTARESPTEFFKTTPRLGHSQRDYQIQLEPDGKLYAP